MIKGDTMEVIILASGSKGNATVIKINGSKILIDIGISYTSFKKKTKESNVNIKEIEHLLLTHEHGDHIRGLKRFIENHPNVKIYLTKGTFDALEEDVLKHLNNYEIIKANETFFVNNLVNIATYELSHDANEPVGFVISYNNKKAVIATDTGYIDEKYFDLLKNANFYLLEANHEPALLMDSRRPYYLKQRITGIKGHLSNDEAAWLMNNFTKDISETVWAIAHISEDCNTNYNIEKSIVNIVEDPTKIKVVYTSQETSRKITL